MTATDPARYRAIQLIADRQGRLTVLLDALWEERVASHAPEWAIEEAKVLLNTVLSNNRLQTYEDRRKYAEKKEMIDTSDEALIRPVLKAGAVRVTNVALVVNDPHAKLFLVDCSSKYYEPWTQFTEGVPGVLLLATPETLEVDTAYVGDDGTLRPTYLVFTGLKGWSISVSGGRYETTVVLWDPDEKED